MRLKYECVVYTQIYYFLKLIVIKILRKVLKYLLNSREFYELL